MPIGPDTDRQGSDRPERSGSVPTPHASMFGVYEDAPLPEGHDHATQHAWGGRAIFRRGLLDLPHDRHGTAGPEEGRRDFQKLVAAALPSARDRARAVQYELTDTHDWHVLHSDENITIHGNARGQRNNYLHLSAFRTPEGGVQPVAQNPSERRAAYTASLAEEARRFESSDPRRAEWLAQREAEGS